MLNAIRRLFGGEPAGRPIERREHIAESHWPAAIYAVGDIHGCATELRALEAQIVADGAAIPGEKWLVYLGDYIDRGPDSAGVLDRLTSRPPESFRRICLVGNHEVMALSFLGNPRTGADWLSFGGQEFLASYGLSVSALQAGSSSARQAQIDSHIPGEHIAFLKSLAVSLSVPGCVFVHAGVRPGIPMDEQVEQDLLWIRDEFFEAPPQTGLLVVHGHTPAPEPVVTDWRICVDTGAFATGILTAVRLMPDGSRKLLSTGGDAR